MTRAPLHRDGRYIRIWLVGWLTGVTRWLELLVYGIYVFEITESPIMVALVVLIRFVPLALLSLLFGAAADQLSPRKLLVWSLVGVGLVMTIITGVQLSGALSYGIVLLASFTSGVFWAWDMPLRRKMIGEIAGPDRLAQAMSWDYATSNGTRMLGPLVGGVLYDTVGMSGVFILGVGLYISALFLALGIGPTGGRRSENFSPTTTIIGSLRTFRRAIKDNDALMIMAVTVVFNIWGFPFISMVPVIGAKDLDLNPSWIGYISSIEGLTGLIGAFLFGVIVRPSFYRRLYLGGVIVHLACVAYIGLAPGLLNFSLALAVAGFATSAFAAMQATLIYLIAPSGMRGRYLGLVSICIGAGLIGFANVGLMAELFGAKNALCIIAAEGAVASVAIAWYWRALHRECWGPAKE